MNTSFFKAIFIALFLTTFSFDLKAQEDKANIEYELAILSYNSSAISVVYSNAPTERTTLKANNNWETNSQEFLKQLQVLISKGWKIETVIPVAIQGTTQTEKYLLKRKIK